MRRLLCMILIASGASAATVKTRDGRTFDGVLSFDTGTIIVTSAGKAQSIKLDDLALASFDAPATTRPIPSTQPSAWTKSDVGEVNSPGSTQFDAGRIVITDHARGFNNWRKAFDSFHFAHQRFAGDGAIVVRVRDVEPLRGAKAGVMFRANLAPDSPFVMICRNAEGQTILQRRAAEKSDPDEIAKGERRIAGAACLKLERAGYAFTASESVDGKSWTLIGQCNVPMDEAALLGLVAASNPSDGASARSIFDKLQIIPAGTNLAAPKSPRGIVTKSGSTLACEIIALDETNLTLRRDNHERIIPAASIARCVFVPLIAAHQEKLAAAPNTGLLLINGDFLEGDVKAVHANRATVTSVLFGTRHAELAREAAACVLRTPENALAQFEVKLLDNSLLRATAITLARERVTIDEPLIGKIEVATNHIASIKRL